MFGFVEFCVFVTIFCLYMYVVYVYCDSLMQVPRLYEHA